MKRDLEDLEAVEQRVATMEQWDLPFSEHEVRIDAMACRLLLQNAWPFEFSKASLWVFNNRGKDLDALDG